MHVKRTLDSAEVPFVVHVLTANDQKLIPSVVKQTGHNVFGLTSPTRRLGSTSEHTQMAHTCTAKTSYLLTDWASKDKLIHLSSTKKRPPG